MAFHIPNRKSKKGITLLLVILITTSLMSIAIAVFNFVITELRISGELSDSFYAIQSADQGLEKMLYLDRVIGTRSESSVISDSISNGACYTTTITKSTIASTTITTIQSIGKYQCTEGSLRQSTRSLQTTYQ